MLCWLGSGALVFFEGKQTTIKNFDIMADQEHPVLFYFYPDGDDNFMDDNAIKHSARNVQNWFAEHQSDFQHLPRLPSPDLNPKVNVSDMVERCIRQHYHLLSNLQDLKSCIVSAWYSLDVNALQKYICLRETMKLRI
ncbi:uncharacterized protein TNCV_2087961 [Trichonephila clavipes]|nr:uncharacterized protein TNCV_2087961 [Trichonephila clavipes]